MQGDDRPHRLKGEEKKKDFYSGMLCRTNGQGVYGFNLKPQANSEATNNKQQASARLSQPLPSYTHQVVTHGTLHHEESCVTPTYDSIYSWEDFLPFLPAEPHSIRFSRGFHVMLLPMKEAHL